MIIANYPTFRSMAAVRVSSTIAAATFADANPDTIADPAGDFVADGVEAGMVTRPNGTASNDGMLFTVDTVGVNLLTLSTDDAVVIEGPVGCTLDSYWLDRDGLEEFPGPFGHTNKVRSGGFDGGIDNIPTPWIGTAFSVSVNAFAADAVKDVHEYHWYLSQRTDDPAKQYVSIDVFPLFLLTKTYSGSVLLNASALAATELGSLSNPTPTQVAEVFKHCDLYCLRVADGAIQWTNLLRTMFGAL